MSCSRDWAVVMVYMDVLHHSWIWDALKVPLIHSSDRSLPDNWRLGSLMALLLLCFMTSPCVICRIEYEADFDFINGTELQFMRQAIFHGCPLPIGNLKSGGFFCPKWRCFWMESIWFWEKVESVLVLTWPHMIIFTHRSDSCVFCNAHLLLLHPNLELTWV